ncbi:MAG TPA: alcohol dehydrogenase catalytic domain-containing protein [Gaiellaceae bacterium]|nr:alcohol dehydrogenase catalytic domain-containing protein [Gaiellaceae bacterium]
MDALVVHEPNRFSIENVPRPEPGENELLCKVHAVAICGTDPHIISGDFPGFWPKEFPFIPGHEWAGEVVGVGSGAERFGWKTGTRVAGTSHAGCGFCRRCVEGRYNVCENYGNEAVHRQYGHYTQGSYAEYVVHSIASVFPIPDSLGWDEAAMLDPTAIALHTVKRGRQAPGDTVVVVGPGVMGLLVAECAWALGAGRVIVVGRGERLAKAAALGNEPVDFTACDPVERVRELTAGVGAEVALECSGDPAAVGQCADMLRRGGRVAVIGIPLEDAHVPMQKIVLDELEIVGVRAAAGEMPEAIALVAAGKIHLDELITHRFALREYAEALRTFSERVDGALKVIVYPWQT